jgi:hypothetical protein
VTSAVLFVLARRARLSLNDDGIRLNGIIRRLDVAWSDVEYIGWFVWPSLAPGARAIAFFVFKQRTRNVPYVVWIAREQLARASGLEGTAVDARLQALARVAGVEFRPRVPGMNPSLYTVMCAGTVAVLVGILSYYL